VGFEPAAAWRNHPQNPFFLSAFLAALDVLVVFHGQFYLLLEVAC